MDNLFAKREAVCIEVTREKHRKEMRELIEKYNNKMKEAIVSFYKTHETDIKRIIAVCAELKMCGDGGRLTSLKKEYDAFKQTCRNFYHSINNSRRESLPLYERSHGTGELIFPRWDVEVVQEWLIYWKVPVIIGGTSQSRNPNRWEEIYQMYHIAKTKNELVVGIDQDYNGEDIWIHFVDTICDCHRWRERYGLMDFEAIVLHTM